MGEPLFVLSPPPPTPPAEEASEPETSNPDCEEDSSEKDAHREWAAAVGEGDRQDRQPQRYEDEGEGADRAAVDPIGGVHACDSRAGSETTITRQGRSPRTV